MTRTRLGLLGLCAMVFGLMAFGATMAHAEKGAQWLLYYLLESKEVSLTFLEATVGLEAETTGVLHSKVAGVSALFECTAQAAVGAVLKTEGKVGNGSKIKFSGCITKLNGTTSAACKPNAGGKESGVIITASLHALLELHELKPSGVKDDVIRVLADSGETLATVETGEECAIGEKVPVIGKLTLKDCENLALTNLIKHLIEVGPLTELWVISKTAEHVATLLGSGWVFLTGEHAGLKFSGDPA